MKNLVGLLVTGFTYFLFASANKTFNTFSWTGASLYFFGCIVFICWGAIIVVSYLDRK